VRDFRASVLVRSTEMQHRLPLDTASVPPVTPLRIVNHPDEG
jgi:hypothetical protein